MFGDTADVSRRLPVVFRFHMLLLLSLGLLDFYWFFLIIKMVGKTFALRMASLDKMKGQGGDLASHSQMK